MGFISFVYEPSPWETDPYTADGRISALDYISLGDTIIVCAYAICVFREIRNGKKKKLFRSDENAIV